MRGNAVMHGRGDLAERGFSAVRSGPGNIAQSHRRVVVTNGLSDHTICNEQPVSGRDRAYAAI